MQRKVSVIIPVIRPDKIKQLEGWIYDRAGIPRTDIEILTMEDENRVGAPKMVKQLIQMSTHPYVMYLGDDCEPEENFILNAFTAMKKFDGNWGLVGLNCGRWIEENIGGPAHGPEPQYRKKWQPFLDHGEVAQHWMAHKRLLKHLDGEFFHTGYAHCFCDNELTQRCKDIKRYRFSEKSKIIHHHPIVMEDDSLWNRDLKRVYSDKVYNADFRLFNSRKANGWKTPKLPKIKSNRQVVILVPVHGEGFQKFWTQVSRLQFRSLSAGIDTFLRVKSSAVLVHCRNCLVSEALRDFPDATHFLFIDSDMVFPDDILLRLLEHDKDMVTVSAYRKGPPHFPVVSIQADEDDIFRPIHIKPENGKLRRVTSAGTGVVLIKREVFEKMFFPWFQTEYVDPIGEDAEQESFKLYCDFSIEIGHIGKKVYTWKDHEQHLEKHPELIEVSKDGKRKQIDDEDADPGDSRNRNRQHDQPGLAGRM
jgi:hypothetical protein